MVIVLISSVSVCTAFQTYSVQHQHHRRCSSLKPLHYAPTKDAHIVEANRKYLMDVLGFTEKNVQRLQEGTNVLTLDIGVLESRANWLTTRLKLRKSKGDLKKITRHQPHILGRLQSNLAPKIDYLQSRLLLNTKSLRKLLLSAPHILPCNIEDNIEPTLDWLQQRLDLDDVALSKLIQRQPYTLGCSITDNLEPTLNWIQTRLNFDNRSLSKVVQKMPQIMHQNVESSLEYKLGWLQQRLNLDEAALGKMIQQSPTILGLSIDDNIQPKLIWIQQSLSLTEDGLTAFIKKCPFVLCCNIEKNLEPTLNFYIDALNDDEEEAVIYLITQNPTLLIYSLEKRLKPRLQETLRAGIEVNAGYLRKIGQCSEPEWNTALAYMWLKT